MKYDYITDTPKDKFLKIWRTLWFVRVYKVLKREFAKPTLPIKFPMNAEEFELNRNYYAKKEGVKQ